MLFVVAGAAMLVAGMFAWWRAARLAAGHANAGARELERVAHALRESEETFRRLVTGIRDQAMYTLDPDGLISTWNAGAERMKGFTASEVIGRHFSTFFPPHEVAQRLPHRILRDAAEHGSAIAEGWRIHRDGSRIWSAGVVDALRSESGALIGYSVITRDLTERKQAEARLLEKDEQLRRAQKMEAVGQLAGGVAHDFNNILTAIGGFTKLLTLDLAADDHRRAYVDEIERAKDRAAALTSQLLAFSRMRESNVQAVDMNARVHAMEAMLRRLVPADIALESDLEPSLPSVLIDPIQLEQVIMNLILNARDAIASGGRISIRTRRIIAPVPGGEEMEGFIALTVEDTGHGMDEHTRSHIFEPFFSTKHGRGGTGLGLAMVEGIVAGAGGQIHVKSTPGVGTTFTVVLPHAAEWTHEPEPAPPVEPAPGSAYGTIIVADDDEAVRMLAAAVLERAGYNVLLAEHGGAALQLFEQHRSDVVLVVSDAVMPVMNGRELAERLQTIAPDLPILFISGYAERVLATRGVLDADVQLVQKPFMPDDLLQAISLLLAERRSAN